MPTAPFPIPSPVVARLVLVAEAAPQAADEPPDSFKTLITPLTFVLIAVAAWLLLFRPEREQRRRQQSLLAALKKNDRVLTAAGIYGTVTTVDRQADRVQLRIDDTARITVTLSSIARVLGDKPDGEAAAD